jgi:F-type H+-transporting ATPase subunit b
MEIISATALISINETFFIQLISFLVFLFVLNRVMIRPLISTMDQRKEYLVAIRMDIDEAKSDLDDINQALDKQRSQVLKDANASVQKLDDEADHRASEVIESARSQIAQLRKETQEKINAQLKEVRSQLAGEVDAVTIAIMEKVLHRRLQS